MTRLMMQTDEPPAARRHWRRGPRLARQHRRKSPFTNASPAAHLAVDHEQYLERCMKKPYLVPRREPKPLWSERWEPERKQPLPGWANGTVVARTPGTSGATIHAPHLMPGNWQVIGSEVMMGQGHMRANLELVMHDEQPHGLNRAARFTLSYNGKSY